MYIPFEDATTAAGIASTAISHPEYKMDAGPQIDKMLDYDRQQWSILSDRAQRLGLSIPALPTSDAIDPASSPAAAASQYIAIAESLHSAEDKITAAPVEQVIISTRNSGSIIGDLHRAAFQLREFWRATQPSAPSLPSIPPPAESQLDVLKRIEGKVDKVMAFLVAHS